MSNPTDMELAIVALQAATTVVAAVVAGTGDSIHAATEHVIGAHERLGTADQFYKWLVFKRDGDRVFTLDAVKFWPEDESEDNLCRITIDDVTVGSMWSIPAGVRVILINATIGGIDYQLADITFQSSTHSEALKDVVNKLNSSD